MVFLDAKGISKSFELGNKKMQVLHNCTLSVKKGEFVSIVGSSGSGKTTLLTLLAGLDKPSTGTITLDGKEINTMSEDDLAALRTSTIGYVFQSFHLIESLTAKENVMFTLELRNDKDAEEKATKMLHEVGLSHRIDHYPHQLSGGEQQRVALARAVAHQPSIIFADEPTGNLDSKNGQVILDLLQKLRKKYATSLVIITHDKDIAAKADRSIVLKDGRIQ